MFLKCLNPILFRDAADGAAGNTGDAGEESSSSSSSSQTPPTGGEAGDGSFFKSAESSGENDQNGQNGSADGGDGGDRPEWLKSKYKTVEDQAKGYNDLYASYSKKTDDLRKEIFEDAVKEYGKTIGVPEDIAEYAYPEGFDAPAEEVDGALRNWAQKNNINGEAFNDLVADVWAMTVPNPAAELERLGENAEARLEAVNNWHSKNLEGHDEALRGLMTTAAGIELLEAIMDMKGNSDTPNIPNFESKRTPLTKASIREKQADPRYKTDPAYQKYVEGLWQQWAQIPEARRQ